MDALLTRRSLGGDFLWAVSMLRQYPSLVGLVLLITVVFGVLWPFLESVPQTWPLETPIVVFLAVLSIPVRSYVATVTGVALTASAPSRWQTIGYSLRRVPAVTVTVVAVVLVSALALVVSSLLAWGIVAGIHRLDGAFGAWLFDVVFDGPVPTLLFGSSMVLAAYKFWLAAEICVVGRYGPLASLRLSWAITTLHRWRVVLIVTGFAVTVFGAQAVGFLVTMAGGGAVMALDWGFLVGFLQGLMAVVVFAVGTQVYARAVLG